MADSSIPYGGGRRVLFASDLPSVTNEKLVLPEGVTWGDVERLCMTRRAAGYAQGMFKDPASGRLLMTDGGSSSIVSSPEDGDREINIFFNYVGAIFELIIVLK